MIRLIILSCVCLLASVTSAAPFSKGAASRKIESAVTSNEVLDSIGVCAHLGRTPAESLPNVRDALQYTGIKYVRYDLDDGETAYGIASQLYDDLGIKFVGVFTYIDNYEASKTYVSNKPEMFIAVEGMNEVDHNPISYDGWPLYESERKASALIWDDYSASKTIYAPSLSSSGRASSANYAEFSGDFNNIHVYPASYGGLSSAIAAQNTLMPRKDFVLTEHGAYTKTSTGEGDLGAVTERVQAKYILNGIFYSRILGIRKAFSYELIDKSDETEFTDANNHYGLYYYNMTPKLSATVLSRLHSLLENSDFTRDITINISESSSEEVYSYRFEKSDGSIWIALVKRALIWDYDTGQEIINQPADVSINVEIKMCATQHDVIENTQTNIGCGDSFSVSAQDYVTLVQLQ